MKPREASAKESTTIAQAESEGMSDEYRDLSFIKSRGGGGGGGIYGGSPQKFLSIRGVKGIKLDANGGGGQSKKVKV